MTMMDLAEAHVSRGEDGAVLIDVPDHPWLIRVWTHTPPGTRRPRISVFQVEVRDDDNPIPVTAYRLGQLPATQILRLAATQPDPAGRQYSNETYHRMLAARPKPPGSRLWDDSHWADVLAVYGWAVEVGWPGGGRHGVADLWEVSAVTADRWLAEARRRAATDEHQEEEARGGVA